MFASFMAGRMLDPNIDISQVLAFCHMNEARLHVYTCPVPVIYLCWGLAFFRPRRMLDPNIDVCRYYTHRHAYTSNLASFMAGRMLDPNIDISQVLHT